MCGGGQYIGDVAHLTCDVCAYIRCALLVRIGFDVEFGEAPEECGSVAHRFDVLLGHFRQEASFDLV